MATPEQIAWAAGLFEGEGCFTDRRPNSGSMRLTSTDRDVVAEFAEIVGGDVVEEARVTTSGKSVFTWETSHSGEIRRVTLLLLPWFQSRRRARAEEMLRRLEKCRGPYAERTHCAKGHPYSDANTRIRASGARVCRICARRKSRRSNLVSARKRRLRRMRSQDQPCM